MPASNSRRDEAGGSPDRPGSRKGEKPRTGGGKRSRSQRNRVDAARLAAFDLINLVEFDGAYANIALPNLLTDRGLGGLDARFTTELAFGTLRLQGRYDAIIARAAGRETAAIDPPLLTALRLGVHQLLGMDVPSYAAVSVMVDLVGQKLGPGQAKFTNAVLRRVARQSLEAWITEVAPDPVENLLGFQSVSQSHPEWVVAAFRAALAGSARSPGELAALLAVNNETPPVTLVARPGRITQAELLTQSGGEPGTYAPWAVRMSGVPGDLPAIRTRAAGVQDEGSQLMALALSRAPVACPDTQWLDMCAGPGGKAAVLAGLAQSVGATFTATEIHEHRATLVRQALRWDGSAMGGVQVRDATAPTDTSQRYSRILLDAPCTGLGALRRRPEARWRRTPVDLTALAALQSQLLEQAIAALAPGGVVAYVTCSPVLEETSYLVERVLQNRTDVEVLPAAATLPEVPDAGSGNYARLWPHLHGTDGMFLALLQRKLG
ncbi:MAG: hypothetical protein K0U64_07175 [Actinomycetia bacterium]|nr:hypothetical protein [Actinomycetes bacterium]